MSVKRISGGDGYRYLMQSVVAGDGNRLASTPLTRYYTETGTPPGRWMGAGLNGLGNERGIQPGSVVSEEQLFQLLGMGADPVTGDPLGLAPQRATPGYRERVHARLAALPAGLAGEERAARIEQVRREERQREFAATRKAVTGFDLTFSVPKSVSAVWAVADAATQERIVQAHHAAIRDALAWAEREVFATRIGKAGATRVPVRGVVAAGFDHYDSRANDPHLHTHLVVANRVQTEPGGKWRTLDSRTLFRATVALSELHQGLLMDRITTVLGVGWDGRTRRHSPVPQWEITGVPDGLRAEFSQRASQIDKTKDNLVAAYRKDAGHNPSPATVLKLRQQATLIERPDKQLHSLAELTAQWRDRAAPHLGTDPTAWVHALPHASSQPLPSTAFTADHVQQLAEQTLAAVADKRATFTRWNLYAETQRQLQPIRLASATDREQLGDRITDSALGLAVLLTERGPAAVPANLEQLDRGVPLRHAGGERYTTRGIWDAEERLLVTGRDTTGPALDGAATLTALGRSVRPLSAEQQAVIADIATSGRRLDLLVGAAGTGKTAALAGLVTAWHATHGPGSVVGLAPSAAAADVLASELRLPTENTAKWLTEAALEPKRLARLDDLRRLQHRLPAGSPQTRRVGAAIDDLTRQVERWRFKPGQLVIVDEASLAGTITLDRLVAQARDAGSKILLVGDHAQLSAIDAGGAFGMLARDRADAPELADIRRFSHPWEKQASLALRAGIPTVLDTYTEHGRIHDGDRGSVLDQAYAAWLADQTDGKQSLLIAADADTVADLNTRARTDLIALGQVHEDGVPLADGTTVGSGDRIVTRHNDRILRTGRDWVKNGDQWTVLDTHKDGALVVQRDGGSKKLTLPADYAREHVELGYATTAYRAQGRTVDTAHTLVGGPGMTREALYVAATRARAANHLYVAIDDTRDVESSHGPGEYATARDVLTAVLNNVGADLSAHETVRDGRPTAATGSEAAILPGTRVAPPAPRPAHLLGPGLEDDGLRLWPGISA